MKGPVLFGSAGRTMSGNGAVSISKGVLYVVGKLVVRPDKKICPMAYFRLLLAIFRPLNSKYGHFSYKWVNFRLITSPNQLNKRITGNWGLLQNKWLE